MSNSRKWATSVLVAASMAVVGTASALDEALVDAMAADITAVMVGMPINATNDTKAAAIKAMMDSKPAYAGKIDELIQALADARAVDAVAVKVVMTASANLPPAPQQDLLVILPGPPAKGVTITQDSPAQEVQLSEQIQQALAAARIASEARRGSITDPVTAAGSFFDGRSQNFGQQQQQQSLTGAIQDLQSPVSTPIFQTPIGGIGGSITSNTPSSQGAGTGVSRT